jgi:hypothetical protein
MILVVMRTIASHRIASHRIASHRIARTSWKTMSFLHGNDSSACRRPAEITPFCSSASSPALS